MVDNNIMKEIIENLGKEISCVYGEAGTGKTTFCIMAAVDFAKRGKRVYYLDTENGCEMKRITQIAGDENALEKIFFTKCDNFDDQCRKIEILSSIWKKFDLIVIDTIGNHYRDDVNKDFRVVNYKLVQQMNRLSEISKEVPVLIANQVSANMETSGVKLIGGKIVERRSKKLIKLEKKPRKMKFIKPKEKVFLFEIEERGIII
jgi:DNA repair protein RadB